MTTSFGFSGKTGERFSWHDTPMSLGITGVARRIRLRIHQLVPVDGTDICSPHVTIANMGCIGVPWIVNVFDISKNFSPPLPSPVKGRYLGNMKALLPFFIRSLHVSTSLMSLVFFVGLVRGFPLGETQSGLYKLILCCGPGPGGIQYHPSV